jgi:hypothetical protein
MPCAVPELIHVFGAETASRADDPAFRPAFMPAFVAERQRSCSECAEAKLNTDAPHGASS